MSDPIQQLKHKLARVQDLKSAAAVLEWDQETYMPDGAADARSHQVATLRRLAHEFFTDDEVGRLIEDAAPLAGQMDPESDEAALVRVTRRDYQRARKLPADLIADLARAVGLGMQAWKKARAEDDYSLFAPHLREIVALNVQKAEALGYEDRPYDALLDEYEPGMKTATVASVFSDLRARLVPLVQAIAEQPAPDDTFLHRAFDQQKQWDFGLEVIRAFGYDFERGRQDVSAHPFTTTFSVTDVRVTTRLDERFFNPAFFGTLHEAGHGLYEQGVDVALDRTPLAEGTSLGIHESQSRLWENLVGRSLPFWEHYYPHLEDRFPKALAGVSMDDFYRAINKVAPSLVRVEADELTYNLHIMLRFELENEMIEGKVDVADLPEAWNDRMESYLGVRPDTDADGVLQDIHWSLGTIGYFPTYALGNLMSTQIFEAARRALPDLDDQLAAGRFTDLHDWLRTNIYRHGRKIDALDLLQRVTGQGLSADSWMAYATAKYGALYGL